MPVDGLRLWIVLHEMTHALQFEGYPWLRNTPRRAARGLIAPLADRLGVRRDAWGASPGTCETGGRVGRADDEPVPARVLRPHAGDDVGHRGLLRLRHAQRRQGPRAATTSTSRRAWRGAGRTARRWRPPIFRLTGLDVKLEQYRLGEQFADAVVARQGMEGLNRVWERPENLPTLEEVRDPGHLDVEAGGVLRWRVAERTRQPPLGYEFARRRGGPRDRRRARPALHRAGAPGLRVYRVRWNGNYLVEAVFSRDRSGSPPARRPRPARRVRCPRPPRRPAGLQAGHQEAERLCPTGSDASSEDSSRSG